jgi:D-arabinose 1-dehydrogenase-like Zn-dependent alcohol dehydrogenase
VIPIPDNLELKFAGPLMCAGVTLYSPLKYYGARPGMKIGIIGIGGLGHLGIQYGVAMGCKVTAISSKLSKSELAYKLGATDFIVSSNSQLNQHMNEFDMILSTIYYDGMDLELYFNLLKTSGKFIILGLQTDDMKIPSKPLVSRRIQFCGSSIGSAKDTEECLIMAEKYDIKPMIECFAMNTKSINKALEKVVNGNVHFRAVLINNN